MAVSSFGYASVKMQAGLTKMSSEPDLPLIWPFRCIIIPSRGDQDYVLSRIRVLLFSGIC